MIRILFARVICAWCDKDLGPFSGPKDSHGICGPCAAKMRKELEDRKSKK